MRRDLKTIAETGWDVLVIGGGISGASILRDAAMRGLKAALVEKKDFSHATSSATSKLVHGGLRYLKNFEFGLIRESLRERRVWERIAPHLVYPLPFLVPALESDRKGSFVLNAGLTVYDWLSYDRAWLDDPDQRIPGHDRLNKDDALAAEPVLARDGLAGALRYYDCQMYQPERLGFESIADAIALGAAAANYAEVTGFLRDGKKVTGARVRDLGTGETHDVRARVVVNASGPWADYMLGLAEDGEPSRKLIRSKGIHLIVRSLTKSHAIASITSAGHFFVLPWRGHTILGTTDTVFEGKPEDVGVSEKDIETYLAQINAGLPAAKLTRADVRHFYVGLRPLVDDGSKDSKAQNSYGASRRAEVCDHAGDGADGLVSTIGGKWTTSRHLAEKTIDLVFRKLNRSAPACATATTPLRAGRIGNFKAFAAKTRAAHPQLPPDAANNLARIYGANAEAVMALAQGNDAGLTEPLNAELPDIAAQVAHAARNEMAMTLEDALFRRTGIGTLGHPGARALERAAAVMAKELNWGDARAAEEIAAVERRYRTQA